VTLGCWASKLTDNIKRYFESRQHKLVFFGSRKVGLSSSLLADLVMRTTKKNVLLLDELWGEAL
jgi:hypothetical protein